MTSRKWLQQAIIFAVACWSAQLLTGTGKVLVHVAIYQM